MMSDVVDDVRRSDDFVDMVKPPSWQRSRVVSREGPRTGPWGRPPGMQGRPGRRHFEPGGPTIAPDREIDTTSPTNAGVTVVITDHMILMGLQLFRPGRMGRWSRMVHRDGGTRGDRPLRGMDRPGATTKYGPTSAIDPRSHPLPSGPRARWILETKHDNGLTARTTANRRARTPQALGTEQSS